MKIPTLIAASLISLTLFVPAVQAAEAMEFQKMMQDLGRHMQSITEAIAHEDWEMVARTAPLIAVHAQPSLEEKTRIISFMGGDMPRFKALDMQAHEAAHELEHTAHEKDGEQVIAAFHKVQSSCLSCHQSFRAKFVAHFHATADH